MGSKTGRHVLHELAVHLDQMPAEAYWTQHTQHLPCLKVPFMCSFKTGADHDRGAGGAGVGLGLEPGRHVAQNWSLFGPARLLEFPKSFPISCLSFLFL